jgi:hypothetical protein
MNNQQQFNNKDPNQPAGSNDPYQQQMYQSWPQQYSYGYGYYQQPAQNVKSFLSLEKFSDNFFF